MQKVFQNYCQIINTTFYMVSESKTLEVNQSLKIIHAIKADPHLSIRYKRKSLYKFKHLGVNFQHLLDIEPDLDFDGESDEEDVNNFFNDFNKQKIMDTKCIGCVENFNKEVNLSVYSKHQNYILLKQRQVDEGIIYKSITAVLNIGGGYIIFAKNTIGQSLITEGFKNCNEIEEIYNKMKMAMADILPKEYNLNCTIVPFDTNDFIIRVAAFPNKEHYRPFYKMILYRPSFHYFKDGQIREVKPKNQSQITPSEQCNEQTNCYQFMHQKFRKVSSHYGIACESRCQEIDYFISCHSVPENKVINNKQKLLSPQECLEVKEQLISLNKKSESYKNMFIFIPHKNIDPLSALNRLDGFINCKQEDQRNYQVVDISGVFKCKNNYEDKNSYLVFCDLSQRYIKQIEGRNDFNDCIIYGIKTQIKFKKVLPNSFYQACSQNLTGIFGLSSKLLLISPQQQYSKQFKEKVNFKASLNIMGSQLPKMQSFITFYYLYLHEFKPQFK